MMRCQFAHCSPIFVIGSARSGTTLLQLMLNAHPAISLIGELHFFDQILALKKSIPDLATPGQIDALCARLPRLPDLKYLKGLDQVIPDVRARLKSTATPSYEALYCYLMEAYAAPGARRFGEKTTANMRYLDELVEIFPACQIVHVVRDPRDSVASRLKVPWTSDDVVTNALKWRIDVSCVRSFRQRRDPQGQYLFELRYDVLVREPAATLQAVCSFLGEEYHESMLAYHRSAKEFIKDEPWKLGAARPVYASSLELWHFALSETQQVLVEGLTGHEMERFGYARSRFSLRAYAAVPLQLLRELYRWIRFKIREHRELRRQPETIGANSGHIYRLFWRMLR